MPPKNPDLEVPKWMIEYYTMGMDPDPKSGPGKRTVQALSARSADLVEVQGHFSRRKRQRKLPIIRIGGEERLAHNMTDRQVDLVVARGGPNTLKTVGELDTIEMP